MAYPYDTSYRPGVPPEILIYSTRQVSVAFKWMSERFKLLYDVAENLQRHKNYSENLQTI